MWLSDISSAHQPSSLRGDGDGRAAVTLKLGIVRILTGDLVPQRSKNIDVLRGAAILLVFFNHIYFHSARCSWINPIISFLSRGGWVGVDLFFVLSGFLISNLLFDEFNHHGHINFTRFFVRRGFKIYPIYYLMIGMTFFILSLFHISLSAIALWPFLVFLQNYFLVAGPFDVYRVWGPTWSLAVEEQFYVLLPLLLMGLSACSKRGDAPFRKIPFIFLFVAVLCLSLRISKSTTVPFSVAAYLCPFHLRADTLFFGVLIAYYYTYHLENFKRVCRSIRPAVMGGLGIFCLLPAFIFYRDTTRFIYTAGFSLVYLGSGLILIAFVMTRYKTNRFLDALSFIGRYSYPIYLCHMPFATLATHMNGIYHSGALYIMTYFFAPIAVGAMISKWIEIPLLRLRDKIVPSRSRVLRRMSDDLVALP